MNFPTDATRFVELADELARIVRVSEGEWVREALARAGVRTPHDRESSMGLFDEAILFSNSVESDIEVIASL